MYHIISFILYIANKSGGHGLPDYQTPSQRRLSNVNLSGIMCSVKLFIQIVFHRNQKSFSYIFISRAGVSYQSPASRLIKKSSTVTSKLIPYQLPASRISGNNPHYANDINPRLFDAYNKGRIFENSNYIEIVLYR